MTLTWKQRGEQLHSSSAKQHWTSDISGLSVPELESEKKRLETWLKWAIGLEKPHPFYRVMLARLEAVTDRLTMPLDR